MATIEGILKSKKKPKEIVELLAEALKRDKKLIGELIHTTFAFFLKFIWGYESSRIKATD